MADKFKTVNETAGQEIRAVDLVNISKFLKSIVMDQLLGGGVGSNHTGSGSSFANHDMAQFPGATTELDASQYAYCLNPGSAYLKQGSANNKVRIAQGVLLQKPALQDGNDNALIPFWFDGSATYEFTIANGDALHPRVDLLQMALTWETADPQARVFANPADYARINMGAHCTNFNSQFRARVMGLSGDNIQVKTQTGGAAAYAENGNQVTFTFVDGVTTVAALEALIPTTAIIAIDVAGTGANILHAAGDVIALTSLTGGADTVLVSQNMNMQRRVVCTLSVKQGVPAASPQYPDADAGCCVVGAVVVGTAYTGAAGFLFDDNQVGAVAMLHDQRMPLNIKQHKTRPSQMFFNGWPGNTGGEWIAASDFSIIEVGVTANVLLHIPHEGPLGRLVGVGVGSRGASVMGAFLMRQKHADNVGSISLTYNRISTTLGAPIANPIVDPAANVYAVRMAKLVAINAASQAAGGYTIVPSALGGLGSPVWTNGHRCAVPFDAAQPVHETLCIEVIGSPGDEVTHGLFLVAEGI